MHKKTLILAVALALTLSGCAGMTETQQNTTTRTAIGTGAGAAAGAAIGALAGNAGIGAAIGAGVGAVGGFAWSKRMEAQKKQMETATEGTGVSVTQTEDNRLKLNIPSDISFESGRAEIKPEMRPVLDTLAQGLINNPVTHITIVGHTDDSGNDAINNPLSVNRAASTRTYLVNQGIALDRISIDGRGSQEPIVANTSTQNRAKNRRVEIFVKEAQQPQMQQQQQMPQQYQQMQQQQMPQQIHQPQYQQQYQPPAY